jgi:competence protein ComEC
MSPMTQSHASGSQWAFIAMLGSVSGAALQLQQPALWTTWIYPAICVSGVLVLVLLYSHGHRIRRIKGGGMLPVLALLAACCCGGGAAGWRATNFVDNALTAEVEGRDIEIVGVVSAMPQRSEAGLRFTFDVESAVWADGREDSRNVTLPKLPPRLSLAWYASNTASWGNTTGAPAETSSLAPDGLHAGERWQMTVRLKAPHGTLNPHGFDYELWMWEQGLQAAGYVRTGARDSAPRRIGDTWQHPVERARQTVRDAVFERVADRKLAGVIAALVTGDQSAIERSDWDVFRASGVAHLMSISGLHITMFAWLAGLFIGWLWRRSDVFGWQFSLWYPAPHAALIGGVALAGLYALFSGWGVPSQRTVWMLITVALLRLSGRRWPWPIHWMTACATVIAIDPWALMQAGFWLSFVAVGVLFATGSDTSKLSPNGIGRMRAVGNSIAHHFREQWTITLALTPLTLLLFQQVSVVGLAANAFAIPWVTLVITPLAMLGVLIPPLWNAAAWAVSGLSVFLQALAQWPFATLSLPVPPLWAAIGGVAGGAMLAMRLPWNIRLLGVPLLLPVVLWQTPRPTTGQFELTALDIGQGNAVLIRTATHSLLYDTGPRYSLESDAGHRVLVPYLRALDERLDMVVLSHRDLDHVGGAPAVLTMQLQASVLSSIEATHPLQVIRQAKRCEAGQHWVWDGVVFEVLHPLASDYARGLKSNALSCVVRIGNGHQTALLAGDIEHHDENALVARGASLKADVLLAPHHGSKTSSSAVLLDAVKPSVVIVQAGYRNRFGHPAPDVLLRYGERGIQMIDSPHCGAATWSGREVYTLRCERFAGRHYWHHDVP